MVSSNLINEFQNFAIKQDIDKCDFKFILRNILYKGAEEANYLTFQFDNAKSEKFRRDKIFLEGVVADLPDMLDREGSVSLGHRATIRRAVNLARSIIEFEQDQTVAQLDMLQARLEACPCCQL